MSFGCSVGDFIAIAGLAFRVFIAYKYAPDAYKYISKDIAALQVLIDRAPPHFKNMTISSTDYQYGQKILEDCQAVLEDLNFLIEKYKRLAAINKNLVLGTVRLGSKDITALQVQLVSETVLLKGFVRSCEYTEVQAKLTDLLGLHGTKSRISVTSIASFAASTKTDTDIAYRQFCKDLEGFGIREDVIHQKGDQILEILESQGMVSSGEPDGNDIEDEVDEVLETAYKNYCDGLYQLGFTEALIPPKDEILKILKSQGIVSSSNLGDKVDDSSTKDIPSFRLSSGVNWFPTGPGAPSLMPEALDNSALLCLAADNSHIGTVKLLFGKGALLDQGGNTFLHCAAARGYTETVKLLLDKGAPIEVVNTYHQSPLHIAAKYGQTRTVELLLREGAPIEAKGTYNRTPLHTAAEKGHTCTVVLLLREGASLVAMDRDNNNPLHLAVSKGQTDIVELLLGKGVQIEGKGEYSRTPLHIAAEKGHIHIVELLLGKGASLGATDRNKDTPLHLAAFRGHTDVVERLLGKGASIEARGSNYRTPLDFAEQYGHTDTAQLLKNKAAELNHGNSTLHRLLGRRKNRA